MREKFRSVNPHSYEGISELSVFKHFVLFFFVFKDQWSCFGLSICFSPSAEAGCSS